jgi:hypothetical protein
VADPNSRPFLQLCQDVVTDIGIAGGQITTTVGNTNTELQRVVSWVARADIMIQKLWSDWTFLWYLDNAIAIPAGTDNFSTTYPFDDIDHKSMVVNAATAGANPSYPKWMDWAAFYLAYQTRVKTPAASPSNWAVDPAGNIWLSHITINPINVWLEYWLRPTRMIAVNDTSPIPSDFDMIIVERAKIMYAERENAPEILSGSTAEYTDTLDKLQSSCLPSGRAARKSRNDETTNPDGYVV